VFPGRNGAITPRAVQLRLRTLAQRQGLFKRVHPHLLRHSFASQCSNPPADLRGVQELLGHADISTTQIYTHLDFGHLSKVYDGGPSAREAQERGLDAGPPRPPTRRDCCFGGQSPMDPQRFHATTIVSVRRDGKVAVGGDGQVTLGNTVMKSNARKVRRLGRDGQVLAGFAGAAADAFTLFELFESKLEKTRPTHPRRGGIGQGLAHRAPPRETRGAACGRGQGDLADHLRHGDVIEPRTGSSRSVPAVPFALSAARALAATHTARREDQSSTEALNIAGDVCIYTNRNIVVEEL
jgi:ATP-dependent HslUV protease subunit HslV